MIDEHEQTAELIAERGRTALVVRLRSAYEEAATAHAELELGDVELDELVQRAVDDADGLQWRRALASAASDELGIGLAEALSHPAVVQAHVVVGAPSYEDELVKLGLPVEEADEAERELEPKEPEDEQDDLEPEADETEDEDEDELDYEEELLEPEVYGDDPESESEDEEPEEPKGEAQETEQSEESEESEDDDNGDEPGPRLDDTQPEPEPDSGDDDDFTGDLQTFEDNREYDRVVQDESGTLRLRATHLGGIADLASPERGVELWFSEDGVDIIRPTKEPLGRLTWDDVRALEVPEPRGMFRRKHQSRSYLVIRSEHGDASFEIPSVAPDELREHLSDLIDREQQA